MFLDDMFPSAQSDKTYSTCGLFGLGRKETKGCDVDDAPDVTHFTCKGVTGFFGVGKPVTCKAKPLPPTPDAATTTLSDTTVDTTVTTKAEALITEETPDVVEVPVVKEEMPPSPSSSSFAVADCPRVNHPDGPVPSDFDWCATANESQCSQTYYLERCPNRCAYPKSCPRRCTATMAADGSYNCTSAF